MTASIALRGPAHRPASSPGAPAASAPPPNLSDFAAVESPALTRFAYLVCGDRHRAEDLVQEAMLSLYRRFGEIVDVEKPVAYVRRAVINAHVSRTRRRAGHETLLDVVPDLPVTDSRPDPAEADTLWTALRDLSDRARAVLVLRYYIGCDDAEIADILGARRGTVRSLASRALSELRTRPEILALLTEGNDS